MFLGPQVVYGAPYSLHDRTTAARSWEMGNPPNRWISLAGPDIGRISEIWWLSGFYQGVVRDSEVLPGSSVHRNPAKLTNNDVSGPTSRVWGTLFAPRPQRPLEIEKSPKSMDFIGWARLGPNLGLNEFAKLGDFQASTEASWETLKCFLEVLSIETRQN